MKITLYRTETHDGGYRDCTVQPYCTLLKYMGFADLDVIAFRKLYVFCNGAELATVSPKLMFCNFLLKVAAL